MGYCGGETPDPTYRKVCASHADKGTLAANGYAAYAETVQLEFDSAKISYADVLDAFFRAHDATRRGKARQYQSVIFLHDAQQQDAAMAALAVRPEVHTKLEAALGIDFWDAEPYHQKWLLQRKRDLFLALGMESAEELLGAPAGVLNAYAAGKLRGDVAEQRLAALGVPEEALCRIFGELVA